MSSSDSSFSVDRHCQRSHSHNYFFLAIRLTLLGLLLSGRVSGGSGTTGGSTTSSGGSSTTRANVQEEVLDVLALEGLGEERGPDGLNLRNLGGGDERLELVGLFAKCVSEVNYAMLEESWCDHRAQASKTVCSFQHEVPLLIYFFLLALRTRPAAGGRTVISRPSSARMRAA